MHTQQLVGLMTAASTDPMSYCVLPQPQAFLGVLALLDPHGRFRQ